MKIVVVGTGYVGLVTGTCFAESGHEVACVDLDQAKIATLRGGGLPIYEPGLEELVRRNVREGRLSFTTSVAEAMPGAEVAFIAVGTPPGETGEADLRHVLTAAEDLGREIRRYTVVVNKSTVPVGSAEKVAEAVRRVNPGADFDVVSNPEFLKEGAAIDDFMRPDRVVVGLSSERARAVLAELYAPFVRVEQPILFMDTRSAELTKYAANAMLATRISFMNDVATLCERLGADVDHVRRGVGSDKRIGYPFLFPGSGFGGSCLSGDETVLVRQDGRARLVELGALFGALAAATQGEVAPAAALRPEGLEALAWRPGSTRAEFLPVAFVTRRPFAGRAVEVRTKMGRRLVCTPDHPFVVTGKDGVRMAMKAAEELDLDDWLPLAPGWASTPVAIPRQLDVLQAAGTADLDAAHVIVHPAGEEMRRLAASGPTWLDAAIAPLRHPRGRNRVYDILRTGSLRLDEVAVAGVSLSGARASTVKNGTRVPDTISADAAFWRIVGLYLAEGHCSTDGRRRRLVWSFHPTAERSLVDEVAGYWARLGVKADVRRGTTSTSVSISSRLLASFFLDVLEAGGDCYSHRIPDPIWNEPEAHRWALLSGLWHGDGSWSLVNGGPSVVLEWGSASRALTDGLLRLLASLGIVGSLRVGRTAKSTVDNYWVRVAGASQVERCLELVKPEERREVRRSLGRQRKRIAPTGYVRSGVTALVRVVSVEPRDFAGPVYSLEVPGAHTFVASGGLVVHNCFPKDLRALIRMARDLGLDFDLLRSVERVNERQKRWLVEKALKHFGSFAGKTFGVWGLSFKPRTDDMREAPSIAVVEGLVGNGARVRAHDPVAAGVARRLFQERVEIVSEPYAAAEGADALFLVTEWNEFRQPDLARLKAAMRTPVLFDGRNVWDAAKARAAGFAYYGVGRGNSRG